MMGLDKVLVSRCVALLSANLSISPQTSTQARIDRAKTFETYLKEGA